MGNFNTDINSYSFNELKELLYISPETDFTKELLETKYNNKINQLEELDDVSLVNELNIFFTKIYNLLYLQIRSVDYSNKIPNNYNQEEIIDKLDKLESNITNLMENKIQNFNSVNESNIPINPITYNTIKKQVAINSEFKSAGSYLTKPSNCGIGTLPSVLCEKMSTSSNFIIELPESINNVISLELVNTDLPNIIYTFSKKKGNTQFAIVITTNSITPSYQNMEFVIDIPDGIWFASDIESFLSSLYLDVPPGASSIDTEKDKYLRYLKFEISESSAKPVFRFKTKAEIDSLSSTTSISGMDYSNIESMNMQFSLRNIIDPIICNSNEPTFQQNNMDEIHFTLTCLGTFGYTLNNIYNIIELKYKFIGSEDENYMKTIGTVTYTGYLESQNIYCHTNNSGLYISVNDFVGNQSQQLILLGFGSTVTADDILSRIPTTGNPFSNSNTNSNTSYSIKRTYHGGVRIRKLHIQILDVYGRIVDFHNYPTNFVFEFTCEYSSEKLSKYRNQVF